jgi:hypothetical protein
MNEICKSLTATITNTNVTADGRPTGKNPTIIPIELITFPLNDI